MFKWKNQNRRLILQSMLILQPESSRHLKQQTMKSSRIDGQLRKYLNLSIKWSTLPQSVLFLANYLILNEQKCKQRSNEVIKSSNSRNHIVVIDILVLSNRKLFFVERYFFNTFRNIGFLSIEVAMYSIIYEQLSRLMITFNEAET